jgi:hypothetical protein
MPRRLPRHTTLAAVTTQVTRPAVRRAGVSWLNWSERALSTPFHHMTAAPPRTPITRTIATPRRGWMVQWCTRQARLVRECSPQRPAPANHFTIRPLGHSTTAPPARHQKASPRLASASITRSGIGALRLRPPRQRRKGPIECGWFWGNTVASAQTPTPDSEKWALEFQSGGRRGAAARHPHRPSLACSRSDAGWACKVVPDERSALKSRRSGRPGELSLAHHALLRDELRALRWREMPSGAITSRLHATLQRAAQQGL